MKFTACALGALAVIGAVTAQDEADYNVPAQDEADYNVTAQDEADCNALATNLAFPIADVDDVTVAGFCAVSKANSRQAGRDAFGLNAGIAETYEIPEVDPVTYISGATQGSEQWPEECSNYVGDDDLVNSTNAYIHMSRAENLICGEDEDGVACPVSLFGSGADTWDNLSWFIGYHDTLEEFGENGFEEAIYSDFEVEVTPLMKACSNWKRGCGSVTAKALIDNTFSSCNELHTKSNCAQQLIYYIEEFPVSTPDSLWNLGGPIQGVENTFVQELIEKFLGCSMDVMVHTDRGMNFQQHNSPIVGVLDGTTGLYSMRNWVNMYGDELHPTMYTFSYTQLPFYAEEIGNIVEEAMGPVGEEILNDTNKGNNSDSSKIVMTAAVIATMAMML